MRKMLIIEPNTTDQFILQKTFESTFELVFFTSPKEAIKYASKHAFDLVLINIHLYGYWDGLAIPKLLKEHSTHPFTAIAITVDTSLPTIKKIVDADFDVYISIAELIERPEYFGDSCG